MPRTGRRMAAGCSPASRTDWNVWFAASPTSKRATTTTTVNAGMATCNHKPAVVSTILRSSTATRRSRPGRTWTPAVFTWTGAARGVVFMRLLHPAGDGSDRWALTQRLRRRRSTRRRDVRGPRPRLGRAAQCHAVGDRRAGDGVGLGLYEPPITVGWVGRQAGAVKCGIEAGEVVCLDDGRGVAQ